MSSRTRLGLVLLPALVLAGCGNASQRSTTPEGEVDAEAKTPPATLETDAAGAADADGNAIEAGSPSDAHGPHEASLEADGGVYDPCPPAGTACAIMPLGDSITDGTAGSSIGGGYRVSLFHRAHTDGKTITFVGSLSDGPATVDGIPFPPHHEGHSGYVIGGGSGPLSFLPGIAPLVVDAIDSAHPNIVTLMIGTNDMNDGDDVPDAPARLAALIDSITGTDPTLLLVVAQITPSQTDTLNTTIQAYNATIPALVQARATAGKHVAIVDMYDAFTADADYKTAELSDNLHPNDAGYAVMAGVWYEKIGALLR
jgi:lysophospholipase L1-like esterase